MCSVPTPVHKYFYERNINYDLGMHIYVPFEFYDLKCLHKFSAFLADNRKKYSK